MGTPNSPARKQFGQWLREKRRSEGLLQREVCAKIGFSVSRLKRLECGYDPLPLKHIFDFSEVYGIDLESFLARLDFAEPELVQEFKFFEEKFSRHLFGKIRPLLEGSTTTCGPR